MSVHITDKETDSENAESDFDELDYEFGLTH